MNTRYRILITCLVLGFIALLVGCEREQTQMSVKPPTAADPTAQSEPVVPAAESQLSAEARTEAVAELQPTEGNQAAGRVMFTETPEGVKVVAEVEGLSPGKHGFHVHEKGDCSAPDASSAGGHFAPRGSPHGAPDNPPEQRHVGDLGNIQVGEDGKGHYDRADHMIRLSGENSIIGKAVVIHAGPDDFTSQPSGASGPRVACGIIEKQ